MINETRLTVRGNVATEPVLRTTEGGKTSLCSFRVAVTARRYIEADRRAVDVDTSFFTVTAWRSLADHAMASLRKGDGVIVVGRLKVRDFVHEEVPRTTADIVAEAIGHDLVWGTTVLSKTSRGDRVDPEQAEADALADEVAAAPVEAGPDITTGWPAEPAPAQREPAFA